MPCRFLAMPILFIAILLAGCGDNSMAEVKGTVKFDGKPLEKGSIQFVPADGKSQPGAGDIKDGHYAAKAPVGACKVIITGYKSLGTRPAYDSPDSPVIDKVGEL